VLGFLSGVIAFLSGLIVTMTLLHFFCTLGFECECLLFPADVELYDPSCNVNHGSGATQDGCLLSYTTHSWEAIPKYHEVHMHERIPDSHRDIFPGSRWKQDRLIHQLQM
jgi:hypothetical protein